MSEVTVVIYFHHLIDGDGRNSRIKIGETSKADHRRRQHDHNMSIYNPDGSVYPLCAVKGSKADESYIKNHFVMKGFQWSKGSNEIFWPVPEIVDYIRWLRMQYFVWVPTTDGSKTLSLESLPVKDSLDWLPREGRNASPPTRRTLLELNVLKLPPRYELPAEDFYVSDRVIKVVRSLYGGSIDLDPASHELANKMIKADKIYSKSEDGLMQDWFGNIWLNPPYGKWKEWTRKALKELKSGRVSQMCVLVATRTMSAKSFHPLLEYCDAVCIFKGRIPFWGDYASTPDDGHAVLYFGDQVSSFRKEFSRLGTVLRI